jgi:hypothetical protein
MRRHRTTCTGILLALVTALISVGSASATTPGSGGPPGEAAPTEGLVGGEPIVFPLLSRVWYTDDFGDPRPNGSHEANDVKGDWRAPVLAAEAGRVKWWTTSARAGCMLYLYGKSGITYIYIHLNNDLTRKRDNRAGCKLGTAYAVKDGARVRAGQQIGYNGDSGDAEGNYHLHFEVRPNDVATSPFPYLQAARRLLVPTPTGKRLSLALRGTPVSAGNGVLELQVTGVRWWPGGRWTLIDPRNVEVTIPTEADVDAAVGEAVTGPARRTLAALGSTALTVFTGATAATPEALRGDPGSLVATRVTGT